MDWSKQTVSPAQVGQIWDSTAGRPINLTDLNEAFLRHVTVVPPSQAPNGKGSPLNEICELLERHIKTPAAVNTEVNGWLESIPVTLRDDLPQAVQYLCLLIAIDFRHWDEKMPIAEVGHPVQQKNFYARVESSNSSSASLHRETGAQYDMVRGSAAMVYLLRRAVEIHGVHWYRRDVLVEVSTSQAARDRLFDCFIGVEEDGVTPMSMPATNERIDLLVSIQDQLHDQLYYDIFKACGFRLYRDQDDRSLASFLQCGSLQLDISFGVINALWQLHERYRDAAVVTPRSPIVESSSFSSIHVVYFLKLAQLTIVALEAAFPKDVKFLDSEERLCVCSDYQLPKALRVAGLIQYDAFLTETVDGRLLIEAGSEEEVSIRLASTVAAKEFQRWFNEQKGSTLPRLCTVGDMDYALWLYGRSHKQQAHHLCRTLMY